jgi:hypothetical protein
VRTSAPLRRSHLLNTERRQRVDVSAELNEHADFASRYSGDCTTFAYAPSRRCSRTPGRSPRPGRRPVDAAGAVIWRPDLAHGGGIEICLVHRPRPVVFAGRAPTSSAWSSPARSMPIRSRTLRPHRRAARSGSRGRNRRDCPVGLAVAAAQMWSLRVSRGRHCIPRRSGRELNSWCMRPGEGPCHQVSSTSSRLRRSFCSTSSLLRRELGKQGASRRAGRGIVPSRNRRVHP